LRGNPVTSHPSARNTNGPSTLNDSDWVEFTEAMVLSTPRTKQVFRAAGPF
jgi:hypothetical protein